MATQTLRIGIDSRQAVTGADQVSRSLRDIQAQAARAVRATESMEGGFNRLKTAAGGLNVMLASLGVGAGFSQMVTIIGNFEQKMSAAKAVTEATAEEMEELNKAARRLGASTSFSATEVAEGMGILGSAGLKTNQIIAAMEPILNLATAGTMQLAKAADIAGSVMGGFGLGASDMTMIADTLAGAAVAGALNVENLGESMRTTAPLAASLGMTLQQTAAAFVVLSNSGIKGEQAATAFNGILASIVDPTKEAEEDIKALGLSFDDLNPKLNTPVQIFQKLAKASLESQTAVQLFGREGIAAILTLANKSGELERVTEQMNKLEGDSKRIAGIMSDNLKGDFSNFTGALEELALQVGEGGLLGGLRTLTQTATGVVRVLAGMGDTLGEQEQYYTTLTSVIQGLAVAIGTVYVARALGPMIARSAEAVQSQIALAASTSATAKAVAASTGIEQAAAAAAVTRAQANVAGAQAQLQMAIAQDRATGSFVAQRAALAQLTAANAQLTAAKAGATAAEAAHGAAIAATTLRARAATVAMRALSGAMAFFGGPIGAAITALGGAIYYLHTRTTEAEKSQSTYNDRLERMKSINAELISASGARRAELEAERQQLLANADAEDERVRAMLASLQAFRDAGNLSVVDMIDKGLKAADQKLGFKGAGVNDAVGAVADVPGMGLLGSIVGVTRSDMMLDTTEKQIADLNVRISENAEHRRKLREELSRAPAVPSVAPAATVPGAGGGGGRGNATIRDIEQRKKAFDDLLVRYGDEASAIDNQINFYGRSAEEVDKATARYELWNAAREAGIHMDDRVLEQIDTVSASYAHSRQELRSLEEAEKARTDAMEESSRVTEASATPLDQYRTKMSELEELLQQYKETNGEVGISQETFNRATANLAATMNSQGVQIFESTRTAAEEYQAQLAELDRQSQLYIQTNGALGISQETFNRAVANLGETMNSEGQQIFEATRTDAEMYGIELEKLRHQLDLYIQTNGQLGISQDTFNRAVKQLNSELGSTTPRLDALARSIPTMSAAFDQAVDSGLGHFEDALVDIITGAKSAREAFADMAKSIAADLARMAIRMAIIQPLAMMFGGMGAFGGTMAMNGGMAFAGGRHTGGIIGQDPARSVRPFASIPRFHSGGVVGAGEMPAVLQKGEGVFTKAQMAAMAPVNNNSTNAPVTINVSVQQNPGGSEADAERQGQIISRHVEMAMGEYLGKQTRNGGILNPNGGY